MQSYLLRRILYAIPIAIGVSIVCFSLVYIAPGDPLETVLPPDATAATVARSSTSTASTSRSRCNT